jgi:hypothetical protein
MWLRKAGPVTHDLPPGTEICGCCGEPLPQGNLAWTYERPDPIVQLSDAELTERTIFQSAAVMSVKDLGNFIRVILPIPVDHDRVATLGIWVCVPQHTEWQRIMHAGRQGGDLWASTEFAGRVVTAVQPWPEIFGEWALIRVREPGPAPRIVHSSNPLLAEILTGPVPGELIQSNRGSHSPRRMSGGPTLNPYEGAQ